jgi:carbon-monoxide dehydrogenase small subunit
MLAVQADGAEIRTVEGLSPDGHLHPVQQAFLESHGLQCGFCTPGFVMSICELLEENQSPTDDEIKETLGGNLCRCTGYENIIKAAKLAAEKLRSAT